MLAACSAMHACHATACGAMHAAACMLAAQCGAADAASMWRHACMPRNRMQHLHAQHTHRRPPGVAARRLPCQPLHGREGVQLPRPDRGEVVAQPRVRVGQRLGHGCCCSGGQRQGSSARRNAARRSDRRCRCGERGKGRGPAPAACLRGYSSRVSLPCRSVGCMGRRESRDLSGRKLHRAVGASLALTTNQKQRCNHAEPVQPAVGL